MFGHESVTAGVAGPEIADDVIVEVGGSFRSHHGISAHRARRQITAAGVGPGRYGRQDFSNSWHRRLRSEPQLTTKVYTKFFDDVATQMRSFRDI